MRVDDANAAAAAQAPMAPITSGGTSVQGSATLKEHPGSMQGIALSRVISWALVAKVAVAGCEIATGGPERGFG